MIRFRITPNELHAKQDRCLDVDQAVERPKIKMIPYGRGSSIWMEECLRTPQTSRGDD